ncbi:MAG TPA: PAS domain S-box protein, partial [Ktedonobacteraceae bacterium]
DDFLLDTASDFLGAGLGSGAACIVIATQAHREGFSHRLRANGLDLVSAHVQGRYFALDAAEIVSQFQIDGFPDPRRFVQVIGGLVDQAAKGRRRVRIFGEIVALLWEQGNRAAALRLEALWDDLRGAHPFSLFCAYPMSLFTRSEHAELFAVMSKLHSRVIPAESYMRLASQDEQLREVSTLQQKALSLQTEIAERQAAEEAHLYLAAIVSSSSDAILSKDLDGIITSWNAAAEHMYGYSAQEIIGQPVTLLFLPDHQDEFTQIMERLRRGERVDHFETIRVRKDGSILPVSVTVSPVKNGSGTVIGASAIARDISKQRALEREREAFMGLVTHELKNPLMAVQGTVQLAQRRLTKLLQRTEHLDEDLQQKLKDMLSTLDRSQRPLQIQDRLINDLLDVYRIQEDKLELHLITFNLLELVHETVQNYQAAYPDRLIALDLSEHDSIPVYADRDRLQQVLSNYLTNALKFSPITELVRVGVTLEGETVRVWVQDHGPGLSYEQQAYIWERFYQDSQTPIQNGKEPGLGLGLYICKQLICRQCGKVGVRSLPGQGATFWFTLPIYITPF